MATQKNGVCFVWCPSVLKLSYFNWNKVIAMIKLTFVSCRHLFKFCTLFLYQLQAVKLQSSNKKREITAPIIHFIFPLCLPINPFPINFPVRSTWCNLFLLWLIRISCSDNGNFLHFKTLQIRVTEEFSEGYSSKYVLRMSFILISLTTQSILGSSLFSSTCCNFLENFLNATLTFLFKSFPIQKNSHHFLRCYSFR
jgi:hypothetical protein